MIFKTTALFFLTLAAAILLLHSIVPHSHYHSEHTGNNHHSHSHHNLGHEHNGEHHHHDTKAPGDTQSEDNKSLAEILSAINHHPEGITFLADQKNYNAVSQQIAFSAIIAIQAFYFREYRYPPLIHYSPTEFFEKIKFYPCTNALRGPPSIAV